VCEREREREIQTTKIMVKIIHLQIKKFKS